MATIDSHSYEAPYDGSANIDGHDGTAETPAANTGNLPKDVVGSKCDTGSQTASFNSSGEYHWDGNFTDTPDLYGTVLFRLSALPGVDTSVTIKEFAGNNDTDDVAYLAVENDDSTLYIRLVEVTGFTNVASTITPEANTWYQVRYRLTCGTSSDADMYIRVRTITTEWTEAEQSNTGVSFAYGSIDKINVGTGVSDDEQTLLVDWAYTDNAAYPDDPPAVATDLSVNVHDCEKVGDRLV